MPSRTYLVIFFAFLVACSRPADAPSEDAADRVFLNGAVYTVDADRSWAEAVPIKDGQSRLCR